MDSNSENAEVIRLSDVCRSCLLKSDNMTPFYPKIDATSDLVAMLSSVGNIEIEMNDLLPSYLCADCEEKLRLSYDFQLLIQRSNEMIRECLSGARVDVEHTTTTASKQSPQVFDCQEEGRVNSVKPPRKLGKVSAEEVEEVIQAYKERFYANIKCIKCGFNSCNARALSLHMTHVHKEMKGKWCSTCNTEVQALSEHALSHAREELKCRFCGKRFTSNGHFTEHLRGHSTMKPYKCQICRKGFIAARYLTKHLQTHTNSRRYKCTFCPRNFSVSASYRKHLTIHDDAKTSIQNQNFCETCGKRVRSLAAHRSKYHKNAVKPAKDKDGVLCVLCGKKFNSASRFRMHMRTHTGEAPYKCAYCDKRTKARNQMIVHERTHTGEKPHACHTCGKAFAQISVLKTHLKIHTGRPEMCEICSKRFCRPAQLRLHMRLHTGEKPFQCKECDSSFKQRSHLTEHARTHSDERPYKCTHCDRAFKQSSSLKSHVRIHSGEKPFKCSQCPYACRQSYSLTQHMRQHVADPPRPDKPYTCTVCHMGFSTVAMLTSHMDAAHVFIKELEITELT